MGATTVTTPTPPDEQQQQTKLLLTTAEACHALGISPWYLHQWVRRGALRQVKLGKRALFSIRELERFVEAQQQSSSDE